MEHPSALSEEALSRGLVLVPQLRQILPEQAPEPVRFVFAEAMDVLRVPGVDLLFRTLANDARYLARAWRGVMPLARTSAFEDAAAVLRAEALLPDLRKVEEAALGPPATLDKIRQLTDTVHYAVPKLLLIANALASPTLAAPGDPKALGPTIPLGIAKGTTAIADVDPEGLDAESAALLERIRVSHGHPQVAGYYGALARWPEILGRLWRKVEPVSKGIPYLHARGRLTLLARELLRGLPWDPVSPAGTAIDVPAVLAVFTQRLLPDLLLDVVSIKALLDGPDAARRSVFSGSVQV